MAHRVIDNRDAQQFELEQDGERAVLAYERRDGAIALIHTEVPRALRGRGVGEALVAGALQQARAEGLRIIAVCSFVRHYLRTHPRENDNDAAGREP